MTSYRAQRRARRKPDVPVQVLSGYPVPLLVRNAEFPQIITVSMHIESLSTVPRISQMVKHTMQDLPR